MDVDRRWRLAVPDQPVAIEVALDRATLLDRDLPVERVSEPVDDAALRLGFDARELLAVCLDHCDRRQQGVASDADIVLIPPRFEDECSAGTAGP